MKLLHISDLHIGKSVNEFSMLEDQRHILSQILSIIDERDVDVLLIAGDVYDKSAPSAEAVALLDWFLNCVAETKAVCIGIPGNHDSAERIAYASGLLKARDIHLPPVYNGSIDSVTIEDEHGPVSFWLLPFIKPAAVRPHFPDAEIGTDYTAACKAIVDACELDEAQRNVLIAHQFVTYAGGSTERTDSELSLGGLDNVDAGAFDAFDYVALGHVHRPQRIGRDTCRYSGSPLKYSFSEARYPKTAPLVHLGPKGDVSVELIPLNPLHDMREIKGPLEELVANDIVESLSASAREDYLHVTLTDALPPLDAMTRLRAVYPNVMALDYDNARSRAEGALQSERALDLEHISPFDLFSAFYQTQNGSDLTELQASIVKQALGAEEV